MKKVLFAFALFVSLFLAACNGCNGPSDEVPTEPVDSTELPVDSTDSL